MKSIHVFAMSSILVFQSICLSQNLIRNGDFESDFAGWMPVESAGISNSVVHSGSKSLMVSDTSKALYSYVYQQLNLNYGTNEITFWVYPASASYFSAFELIANWQAGAAVFITRVLLQDNAISFTAVDKSETISNVLNSKSWNKVAIQVDRVSLKQDFFINDNLVSSLTSSSFPAIEHLLVGDLSRASMYGTLYFDEISIKDSPTTGINDPTQIPAEFSLQQNFPNPFNPATTIGYSLPTGAEVSLAVFDIRGRRVRNLVGKEQTAGLHSIVWDGRNDRGQQLPSGLYFYRLIAGGLRETAKMLLVK